jgi:alpha-tubulin suppressor-like RCC1 family protein
MLFFKSRKIISLILSFMLLLISAIPYGVGAAHAAQGSKGSPYVKVSGGAEHALALKSNGTVVAWGRNDFGQSNVPADLDGVVAIAAGGYHSLALKSDGSIVTWGRNNYGQTSVPAGLDGVVAIAAGNDHSLALRADGTVVAWGLNGSGQSNVPTDLDGVVAIAAGGNHSLALKSDGTVVAWGFNNYGQTSVPTGLDGVVAIAAGFFHSLALKSDGTVFVWGAEFNGQKNMPAGLDGVVAIAAGGYHSLALKSDGSVVAWGFNNYGQSNVPTGLDGVTAISAGYYYSLAVKSDGSIVAWGYNNHGQSNVPAGTAMPVKAVGIAAGYSHSLALKSDGAVVAWGYNNSGQSSVPAGLDGVTAIAAGVDHSLALKADGTVVVWGDNSRGQRNVPAGLDGVTAIAANGWHSLALKADGTVVAWGYNNSDQSSVPAGLDGVVAIAAGMHHSLALKSDGTIVSWGSNSYGQRNVPAGLDGVVAIAAGERHSLALKADGTVVAWGENFLGQANVPAGLNGVAAIAAGEFHSLALKADGTIVGWGDKNFGQANVPAGLDGVTGIAAGMRNSMALKSDGTVVAWGSSNYGQLNIPGDVRLSGLTVQGGGLNPSFSPSVTAYTYYIGSSVSSVQVTATLADAAHAELYVNNQPHASGTAATVNVPGASTVIPVRVEPYLNPPRTYTITVLRDDTPPDVQFAANGNATPAQNAESTVTVNDAESGVDAASLQYAWSQSTAPPADGWNVFANGDTLRQTTGDGNWYLHIRALDLVGNVTYTVSDVFVLDNTAPELTLNGSNPMNIPQGGTYTELGATAFDDNDGVIPDSFITISGTVDTTQLGYYPIQYEVTDLAGNTASVIRDVYVYESDTPVIHLLGPNPMTVEVNDTFVDPGATAQDLQDGDLSASIMVTGTVDPSTLGTYTLSYNVSDAAGNAATTVTRTVYVRDTQPPVLTLLGDTVMRVPIGSTFTDPGARAGDAYYGDVSDRIVVTGTVDTSKSGQYTIRYNVTDPSGNAAAEVTRKVTVTAPVVHDNPDDSENPGNSGTTEDLFKVSVKINGEIKQVDARYEMNSGQRVIRIFPTAEQVTEALATDPNSILIEAQDIGDAVMMDLPTAPLLHAVELRQDALLEWSVNGNRLRIPLHVLQGVSEERTVTFMIAAAAGFVDDDWHEPITKVGGTSLLSHPVVYKLQVKDGDSIDWAPTYALLSAFLPATANPYQATVVRIGDNGRIRFAPSVISNDGLVTIRSPYNGAYAVIESDHSFVDVNGHWAQEDIILMANKLLVEGRGQDQFVPDDRISRAEWAAMLVRALGLDDEQSGATPFRDVAPGAWYAGAVWAAHEAKLIDGFEDGTFRPAEPVTREQVAVMIARAMEYAGSAPVADGMPKPFEDAADIAPWAASAVDRLTGASIIRGLSETTFGPREYATRSQGAVLLKRMLQTMQFINS